MNSFDIDAWYQHPLGKQVAELEKQQLNLLPKTLLGQSVLYLGMELAYSDSLINNYSIIVKQTQSVVNTAYQVQCNYAELPFPTNSFDAIILPHVLEFTALPKTTLMESWHTLAPEGHLIILGFNPISLNNLRYLFDKTRLGLPEHTKFYSINKLYEWLRNEFYEIVFTRNFCYRPISANSKLAIQCSGMAEQLATWLLPYCGGIYLLVIKKRIMPLTPLRLRDQWREIFNNKNIVEPAARNLYRE